METKIAFHFILVDNDVDGDDEAFTNGALEEICKLCIGHYGLFDGTEVKAKITNASIMDSCGATKDGRHKRFIYAEAEVPNNECGRKLISRILLEKPISSIACSALNRDKVADGVTMISNVTDFYNFLLRFDEEKETMNKKDLERRLEAAEKQNLGLMDEIKNLKAQIAEMQDEPEIPDIPDFKVVDDEVWYINNILEVSGPCDCPGIVKDYNNFHVKEYADEFANKCKLIAMMLHCKWYVDRGFVADYENGRQVKWLVYHDHHYGKYMVKQNHNLQEQQDVYFSTEESAQKCADWINKHWKENADE